jgi:hypothetical protein
MAAAVCEHAATDHMLWAVARSWKEGMKKIRDVTPGCNFVNML